ncbi:MAG: hypothetical protein KDB05_27830 [Planctomycetales bacterium]|nr:hypothetical protein [Planctomycetales bacterium]
MQTPEGITVVPVAYQDVLALLTSDAVTDVEQAIASQLRFKIIQDHGATSTSYTQAEISVSGMTTDQIERYLRSDRDLVIAFGVRFLRDDDATSDEQEYPEGEEQDPDGESETLGYGNGFGIKYAIYHNFLANRPSSEFRAFLKNRRIPKHTKFANELVRIFDALNGRGES